MKSEEFIREIRALNTGYKINPNSQTIWEDLEQVVNEYIEENGITDEDAVLLMEKILKMDFSKEKKLFGKNPKYDLATILLGNIPAKMKKILEAQTSPVESFVFVLFAQRIYPERNLSLYCFPVPWQIEQIPPNFILVDPAMLPQSIIPVTGITTGEILENLQANFQSTEAAPINESLAQQSVAIVTETVVNQPNNRQVFSKSGLRLFCHKQNLDDHSIILRINDLRSNPNLECIELQKNKIGAVGAERLFKAIKDHPNLKAVNLMVNSIGDNGAIRMAHELPECKLNILILNENNIGPKGAKALAKALAKNQTINFFGIGYNQIGDQGAIAFAQHLMSRNIYLNLRLGGNGIISKEAGLHLLSLVNENHYITGIDLDGNSLDTEDIESINNQVKQNKQEYEAMISSNTLTIHP